MKIIIDSLILLSLLLISLSLCYKRDKYRSKFYKLNNKHTRTPNIYQENNHYIDLIKANKHLKTNLLETNGINL